MTDLQMVDWLKASMKIALCEKLQGEDFLTPQDLLHRAQRVELDNAVLDARKRQLSSFPNTSSPCEIFFHCKLILSDLKWLNPI